MQLALVIGRATSTVKHASMAGQKLLIVQPTLTDGKPDGEPLLAIDGIGSGMGEIVVISSDGRFVRDVLKADATPVRWSVIGIEDA